MQMDVRRFSQPVDRLPPSPRRLPALWSSPARRLSNSMLSYHPCRDATPHGQQYKSPRTGARGALITMGTSSNSSSPDEMPLTVTRTQRRPASRRHILESDDEGDHASDCVYPQPVLLGAGKVIHGQAAPASPATETQAQHALQDRTNLASVGTGSTSRPLHFPLNGAAVRQELGKPGILELAAILRSKERFDCTSTPALKTGSGLAAPPCGHQSDGSNVTDSPPIRSTRAPRTGRRMILWDDSDSGESPSSRVLGASDLRLPILGEPIGQGEDDYGRNQSPPGPVTQQHSNTFMSPSYSLSSIYTSAPVVENVPVPAARRQSRRCSSLTFCSARSEEGNEGVEGVEVNSCAYGGSVSSLGAALEGLQLDYRAQTPDMSSAREPSSMSFYESVPELETDLGVHPGAGAVISGSLLADLRGSPICGGRAEDSRNVSGSEMGADTARPSAMVDGTLLGLSLLQKVPRRPQRHRDGRDVVGEAAAFMLGAAGPGADWRTLLASGETSEQAGMMHDLYGELQLISQLQSVQIPLDGVDSVIAGAKDHAQDTFFEEDLPLDTPRSPCSPSSSSHSSGSPPPRLLNQLESLSLAGGNLTGASAEELHQDTAGGQGLPADMSPSPAAACSPLSPLHVLTHPQTVPIEVMDLTQLRSTTTSPETPSARSASSTLHLGELSSGHPDTDPELQLECLKRLPTTARRRAFVLEFSSSSEASSPQQPRQQQPESPAAPATGLQSGGHAGPGKEPRNGRITPGIELGGSTLTTAMLGDKGPGNGKAPKGRKEVPRTDGGEGATAGKARAKRGLCGAGLAAVEQRAFLLSRAQLAQTFYNKWNMEVFDGELPAALPLVWNSRLTSTAGQVVSHRLLPGSNRRVPAKLELSPRLIDSLEKLRKTLSHEMCHVAAWHLSHEYNRPHGPAWQSWAHKFMRHDPTLVITRTHDYTIQYAHRWRCTGEACGKEYGRHRMTLSVDRHLCGVCHSRLEYLGNFDRHGNLKASKAVTPGGAQSAAGDAGDAGGRMRGTAAKPLSEFAKFCKENFRSVQASMPARTPPPEIFKHMGQLYQKHKAGIALTTAAGDEAVPKQFASGLGPGDDSLHPAQSPRGTGRALSCRVNRSGSGSGEQRRSADGSDSLSQNPNPEGRLTRPESDELLAQLRDLSLSEDESQEVD